MSAASGTTPVPSAPRPRAGGLVVPHPPTALQHAAGWLVWALIRLVSATVRYRFRDETELLRTQPAQRAVFAVWHNRLALGMPAYFDFCRAGHPQPRLAVMVSASKDGALLAAVLTKFGVQPIRGSTSRRGAQALRELTTWARRDHDLAITPDGPRGPAGVVQDGVVQLAQLTGRPIVPIGMRLSRKLRLKSWDRFQIPLPFARCELVAGKPLRIPREATATEREVLRQQLETALQTLSQD